MNLFVVQKNVEEQLKRPDSKKDILMFEYKLLLLYTAQYGIYLLPQLDNIEIWHGVVFIRNGLYKEGRFKFCANFEHFPEQPPSITFMSEVFHPMIHPETGLLDIKRLMNYKWNYGTENLLCQVFEKIKSIFSDVKKLECADSFNPAAHELFKNNVEEFYIKVLATVDKSKSKLHQNYEGTSMRFTQPQAQHARMAEQLKLICSKTNLSIEDKKKQFLKYLLQ